jgi:hypothetical protein
MNGPISRTTIEWYVPGVEVVVLTLGETSRVFNAGFHWTRLSF